MVPLLNCSFCGRTARVNSHGGRDGVIQLFCTGATPVDLKAVGSRGVCGCKGVGPRPKRRPSP